jgi:tRNA threonylcarbamoyladenosine biosynthesis protein TsaE
VTAPEGALRRWRTQLDEPRLSALATALAGTAPESCVLYLSGELGAGKTTFARAFIRALLPGARVKSPSFSLVEPYALPGGGLYHIDLYRIADPSELEALGTRDLAVPGNAILVEWPERAQGALPPPDLDLFLEHAGDARKLEIRARTATGNAWLRRLSGSA